MAEKSSNSSSETRYWVHILIWTISISGLGGLVAAQFNGWVALTGIGILISMSSATVGASLGFLFAVPRVLTASAAEAGAAASGGATGDGGESARPVSRLLGSNTNLERISDWLTTMLVGVGLSQLSSIGPALGRFSTFLADTVRVGTDGTAGPLPAIGPFLLVLGLLSGFLFFYLQTRLILVPELNKVEQGLAQSRPLGSVAGTVVRTAARSLAEKGNLASRAIAQGSRPSDEDAIRVMRDLLYQSGGYKRVIEMARELEGSAAGKLPDFWFLLTAAYGQEHFHAKTAKAKAEARAGVLESARRAIALDADYRRKIFDLTNPNAFDNDLATLRTDSDLLDLLGRLLEGTELSQDG